MEPNCPMDHLAMDAQRDEKVMNLLVAESKGYILQCASKVCKRFITDSDDEYEVALLAFWEAVKQYNEGSGSFRSFAALVIRRRLMDFFDRQSRSRREIAAGHSMTWDEDEGQTGGVIAEVQRVIVQDSGYDTDAVKEEIAAISDVLRDYGFSFFDVAEASPKAGKTKRICARAVNWMLALLDRLIRMRRTRSLPVAAISAALNIARKILERHRRYIITATEILDGDYPHLAEYLDYIRKERTR